MRSALTAKAVESAKPRAGRYALPDAGHPGLRVLIYPSGVKTFTYRFKRDNGQDMTIVLGPASGPGAITLVQARDAASEARRQRAQGADPADQKRASRKAEMARIEAEEREARRRDDTVEKVLERFYRDHVDGLRSARENKLFLNRELAGWFHRRVDDISETDAIKLIDSIRDRGRKTKRARPSDYMANRARAHCRKFFNWCVQKRLVDKNPFHCVGAVRERARQRVLSDNELRWLLLSLPQLDWPWREFFTSALYLGQRREEIAGMRWQELDLAEAEPTWVLPAERAKNDSTHTVPLPANMVALLNGIDRVIVTEGVGSKAREVTSQFVFTTTGTTSISGFSRAIDRLRTKMLDIAREEAIERGEDPASVAIEPWRLHDLRRTMATNMARLGVDVVAVERVLNHTMRGVMATYQRYAFLPEKRHALNLWASFLDELTATKDSNVVSFKWGT
ncbi:MAG: DUF4102 domain-containing protein [Pseudonocardiaceae bacterium]|nr:MAG: DUF4102 domain-containing protein [Pseudonocardiaceae bacterium]